MGHDTTGWHRVFAPGKLPPGSGSILVLLHGYFFLDSGRKVIRWSASDNSAADESAIMAKWNEVLRDQVTLPLLPATLLAASRDGALTTQQLSAAVAALAGSSVFHKQSVAICAHGGLARLLREDDLLLNIHPVAIRVSANVTPFGAVSVPA